MAAIPDTKPDALMSGADIVVHTLASLGVDTIFGYSGGAILRDHAAVV